MPSSSRISLLDQRLLASLERGFAQHASADQLIRAPDLQRALGLRSEYLARRVLQQFDCDGNGSVDRDEFLRAVRALVFGSDREKLHFAFKLHDDDGDGSLTQLELLRMISIGLAESDVISRKSQPPERLAQVLLKSMDRDGDGRISFDEFAAVMQRHPELLRKMTQSEALWIAPNEDLLARFETRVDPSRRRLRHFVENRWSDVLLALLWVALNVGLFWQRLFEHTAIAQHVWVRVGRAFGLCLQLNAALLFLPVLRRLLTRLRRSWLGRKLALDEAIDAHRFLGQVLLPLALLHAGAFVVAHAHGHPRLSLAHALFGSARTATGVALLALLLVIWSFAQEPIRRSQHFELFYYTHFGWVAFVVLLLAHSPRFALFGGLPLLGLLLEQLWRLRRHTRSALVESAIALRSGVTRLELERPAGFDFEPGDYVFVNLPRIAKHEWHPFTISSGPEQERLTLHVRTLGNWTAAVRKLAELRELDADQPPLAAGIDGPYGTPSARIFAAKQAVLIGAGIGITPFASVLESYALRKRGESARPCALERVHLFWLNRDQYSFEWFAELLGRLERELDPQLLELHICMTGGRAGSTAAGLEIARAVMHEQGQRDLVTGLGAHTHMGHPDWELVLGALVERYGARELDVFFCGPMGLGSKLRALCARLGLRFHEEKF